MIIFLPSADAYKHRSNNIDCFKTIITAISRFLICTVVVAVAVVVAIVVAVVVVVIVVVICCYMLLMLLLCGVCYYRCWCVVCVYVDILMFLCRYKLRDQTTHV